MSKRPTIEIWMPLHFADVTKACGRMSEVEECAYLRLLRDQWLNGPAANDDAALARIVRYPIAKWKKVRPALEPHFELTTGCWSHEPTQARREHALGVREAKRRGANATANGDANAPANGTPNADIRDLSSSSDRLVPTSPSQEGSTDYQVSTSAQVIVLPVRGSHA